MCGISAFLARSKSGFFHDELTGFNGLTWITQLRGYDSTGVVQITNKKEVDSLKQLGTPEQLFLTPKYKEWAARLIKEGKVAFSHCRAATRGTVSLDNAHPFYLPREGEDNGITIIHNGTLNHQNSFPDFGKFDVDSKWLGHCIATYGAAEALSKIDGPIATMWYDSKDGTFNIYRNHERPLYRVTTKEGHTLFNSEEEALTWVLGRNKWKANEKGIVPVTPMHWLSFNLDDLKETVTPIVRVYPRVHTTYPETMGYRHQNYEAPRTIFSLDRGYAEDFEHLFDKRITKVQFIFEHNHWHRITTGLRHETSRMYNVEPYIEGLRSMYLDPDDDNTCLCVFEDKEGTLSTERFFPVHRGKTTPPKKTVPSGKVIDVPTGAEVTALKSDLVVNNLKLKPGKVVHWKHKLFGGTLVNHKARCCYEQPMWFDEYENNQDGKVTRGDKVIVEKFEIEEGTKVRTVYGYRMKPDENDQDLTIEYMFFDAHNTKAQIEPFRFYEGIVNFIRLATKDRYTKSGNVVQVILKDVKPCTPNLEKAEENARVEQLLH